MEECLDRRKEVAVFQNQSLEPAVCLVSRRMVDCSEPNPQNSLPNLPLHLSVMVRSERRKQVDCSEPNPQNPLPNPQNPLPNLPLRLSVMVRSERRRQVDCSEPNPQNPLPNLPPRPLAAAVFSARHIVDYSIQRRTILRNLPFRLVRMGRVMFQSLHRSRQVRAASS